MAEESRDIVERLEEWAGRIETFPYLMDTLFPADLREAIATIKQYRLLAGAISQGQSFRDIAENVPKRPADYELPRQQYDAPIQQARQNE